MNKLIHTICGGEVINDIDWNKDIDIKLGQMKVFCRKEQKRIDISEVEKIV